MSERWIRINFGPDFCGKIGCGICYRLATDNYLPNQAAKPKNALQELKDQLKAKQLAANVRLKQAQAEVKQKQALQARLTGKLQAKLEREVPVIKAKPYQPKPKSDTVFNPATLNFGSKPAPQETEVTKPEMTFESLLAKPANIDHSHKVETDKAMFDFSTIVDKLERKESK